MLGDVFRTSGHAMVRMALIEYSNDHGLHGQIEVGGMTDVSRAISESAEVDLDRRMVRRCDGTAVDCPLLGQPYEQ